jgi:hypothetical protein
MSKASSPIDQLGDPIAYLGVGDGTPVYDRDGNRVGVVEHVLAYSGIFEDLIIHTFPLPGRHLYADAAQIAEIRERGILLSVRRDERHDPCRESGRHRRVARESTLEARLRRALDWLTGAS